MRKQDSERTSVGSQVVDQDQESNHRQHHVTREKLLVRRLPVGHPERDRDRRIECRVTPVASRELVGPQISLEVEVVHTVQPHDPQPYELNAPPMFSDVQNVIQHRPENGRVELRVCKSMPGRKITDAHRVSSFQIAVVYRGTPTVSDVASRLVLQRVRRLPSTARIEQP